jgi:hypothetical protein
MSRVSAAIRRAVQRRAGNRCEYCLIPEFDSPFAFQVEHIRAIKHGGSSELENLAWSCFACNSMKGTDIATYDETTGDLVPLYNPRTQDWSEHFVLQGALIVGQTPIGRATLQLLRFNHPRQIEARQALIEAGLW